MVQGTMSNAGKSVTTAGLCRIFRQDGYSVAPFKSQNMALNSYITKEGLEMGRAQVMQAEAAGIEPSVSMNPILLKPSSDSGSQVIVNGEVMGFMSAAEYYTHKQDMIPHIMKAFDTLAEQYDIIVIEGAGSPAEINLKDSDIVNMGMARLVSAPVLLVGDIDRGGVFASLVGTLALLDEEERDMIKAFVINKFRGSLDILRPGLSQLEQITDKPVAGVIPYFRLEIDDEDSLSDKLSVTGGTGVIDIAVIRLPRISNFTDFNSLSYIDGVSVRYVSRVSEFGQPDMVIIPGTKNTMGDLKWLRESGLETLVKKYEQADGIVFGICGGYQMLGAVLSDPDGIEEGGEMNGIGLLPVNTVFEKEKIRTQVSGIISTSDGPLKGMDGSEFRGYEIHMGISEAYEETERFVHILDITGGTADKYDGAHRGNVYGTYIHGIFDSEETAKSVIMSLMERKGLDYESISAVDMKAFKESQYDKLADIMRESLDMDLIYDILEGR